MEGFEPPTPPPPSGYATVFVGVSLVEIC